MTQIQTIKRKNINIDKTCSVVTSEMFRWMFVGVLIWSTH